MNIGIPSQSTAQVGSIALIDYNNNAFKHLSISNAAAEWKEVTIHALCGCATQFA